MTFEKKILALILGMAISGSGFRPALSDVILEPEPTATLEITAGLQGETPGSGYAYAYSNGSTNYYSAFGSDGSFSISPALEAILTASTFTSETSRGRRPAISCCTTFTTGRH